MKKKRIFLVAAVLLLLFVLPYANAAITISEPAAIYNLGDALDVNVNVSEAEPFSGFVALNLDCDNYKKEIYRVPVILEAEKEKLLEVPSLFLSEHMVGLCYVKAALEDVEGNTIDEASTEHFTISNMINLTVVFNKKIFSPGGKLAIEGKAVKINGEKVDGSVKVVLDGKDYSYDVKGSFFEAQISIAEDIKSGDHDVEISVSDDFGNEGSALGTISITPVPTSLELVLNKNTFLPEENLSVKVILYDQAHDEVSRDAIFSLVSPEGKEKLGIKVLTGESIEYVFERDSLPGDWQINARSAGFEAKETIVMQEYRAVDMSLSDDILRIVNTGNIPYSETIDVEFKQGDSVTIKNETISLDVGEETSVKLSAPDGDYDVSVEGDVIKKTFTNVSLTGRAISVKKLSDIRRVNFIKYFSIALLLFIALLLIGKKLLSNLKGKRKKESLKSEEEAVYQYMQKLKNEGR